MTAQTMQIGNRPCRIYGEAHAEYLLLQMTGEHELQSIDNEVVAIAQSGQNFLFAAIPVESWNDALSPWEAPAVWGKQGFGGKATETLCFLTEQYPLVDLPSGDTLHCKLFPADKFYKIYYLFDRQCSIIKTATN